MAAEDDGGNVNVEVGPKELEVLIAEMETRLRRAILKIIRPTLDQAAEISSRIADLNRKVERHDSQLFTTDNLKEEVGKQVEVIEVMSDQIKTCDTQAKVFEQQAGEQLYELRQRIIQAEQRGEEHEGQLQKIGRDFTRVGEEIERLQKQHQSDTSQLWTGVNSGGKKLDQVREEFLQQISGLQKQHFDSMEEIFGDDKGITKINNEMHQLFQLVAPVPLVEKELSEAMKKADLLDTRQQECDRFCEDTKRMFLDFKGSVNERLVGYAEENKDVMNKLTAYHASILRNVRIEFSEEIGLSRQLREEVTQFESSTKDFVEQVNNCLTIEIGRVDALHRELVTDIEDVNNRRKKDRSFLEGAFRSMASEFVVSQDRTDSLSSGVAHLSKVIGLVLEGERVASALQIQDFADRRGERWLGAPADAKQKTPPTCTADALERLGRSWQERPGPEELVCMVPIEPKVGLAKMEYKPGPVSVGGSVYERQDVLLLHNKLLEKAKSALERGPESGPQVLRTAPQPRRLEPEEGSTGSVAAQPGANGGVGGSDTQVPSKIDAKSGDGFGGSEDPKSLTETCRNTSAGSGQRPGSQHQPQAMGSRSGPLSAPLGSTVPPEARSRRRQEAGASPKEKGAHSPRSEGASRRTQSVEGASPVRLPAIGGASGAAAKSANPMSGSGGMNFETLKLGKKARAQAAVRVGEGKSLSAR